MVFLSALFRLLAASPSASPESKVDTNSNDYTYHFGGMEIDFPIFRTRQTGFHALNLAPFSPYRTHWVFICHRHSAMWRLTLFAQRKTTVMCKQLQLINSSTKQSTCIDLVDSRNGIQYLQRSKHIACRCPFRSIANTLMSR